MMGASAPVPSQSSTTHGIDCKYFASGNCKYADGCKYRHTDGDREQNLAAGLTASSSSAYTNLVDEVASSPHRGFSGKLKRIREVDQEVENLNWLFKQRRGSKLLAEKARLIAQLRVDAEVLKTRLSGLDERIGEETWFGSLFQSQDTLLHKERDDVKEQLRLLLEAIKDVADDEEDVPEAEVEKALCSLEAVPRDSALWRTIVGFVDQRSQAFIGHYGGRKIEVKNLWRVPDHAAMKAMEQQGMTLGRPTQLFHGTAVESVPQIIKHGFRVPKRHTHGGMFGKGIYFAETPLKSVMYTRKEGMFSRFSGWWSGNQLSSGGLQMLLCDVYLGRSRTLRLGARPGLNPEVDLKGGAFSHVFGLGDYHSICAPGGFFAAVKVSEYIVYEPYQAIPKFLIEFERV